MSLKTLLMGDKTIAGVEKSLARSRRELKIAETAEHDAAVAYEVALEDGLDDAAMRAALDLRQTTTWEPARLKKRIAGLESQLTKLKAEARAALLVKLRRELVDLCEAHGKTAAAAAATAASVVAKRMEMDQAGFQRELGDIEMFPVNLIDIAQFSTPWPQVERNEALDRWRHRINQLKASLEIAQ